MIAELAFVFESGQKDIRNKSKEPDSLLTRATAPPVASYCWPSFWMMVSQVLNWGLLEPQTPIFCWQEVVSLLLKTNSARIFRTIRTWSWDGMRRPPEGQYTFLSLWLHCQLPLSTDKDPTATKTIGIEEHETSAMISQKKMFWLHNKQSPTQCNSTHMLWFQLEYFANSFGYTETQNCSARVITKCSKLDMSISRPRIHLSSFRDRYWRGCQGEWIQLWKICVSGLSSHPSDNMFVPWGGWRPVLVVMTL